MWLDSKAVNCPQKWGNFTSAGEVTVVTMVKDSRAASILVPVLPERGERQWRSVLKR